MNVICHWSDSPETREFVNSRAWLDVPCDDVLYTRHRGNAVKLAEIAPFGKVVIKESRITSEFSRFERFGREMRLRFCNTEYRDAKAALAAEKLGIATYHPFAAWESHEKGCTASYIMYSYVEGRLLKDFFDRGHFDEKDREYVENCLRKTGAMARKLHLGGIRHRDIVPPNILIKPDGTLALIDFASGYFSRPALSKWRQVEDVASLRRIFDILDRSMMEAFCRGYCEGLSEREFNRVLKMMTFWKRYAMKSAGGLHFFGHMVHKLYTLCFR